MMTRLAGFGSVAKLSDPIAGSERMIVRTSLRPALRASIVKTRLPRSVAFTGGSKETSMVRARHGDAVADIDHSGCHDVGVHGQEHVAFPGDRAPEWESMRPLAMSISAGARCDGLVRPQW